MAGLTSFWKNTRGNFAMTAAIVFPVLFGLGGLSFDYAIYLSQRSSMQEAADQAVLASVREAALQGWDEAVAKSVVEQFVTATLEASAMTGTVYTSDVNVDSKLGRVRVTIRQDGHGYLLLGHVKDNPQIEITAEAALASGTNICVLTLNDKDSSTILLTKPSQVLAPECGVFANSLDPKAIEVDTTARISAGAICTGGGWSGRPADVDPPPVTDCPKLDDPLADRMPPSYSGCDYYDMQIDASTTLWPGVYCGGLKVSGSAFVTVNPGTYIIKDGEFSIDGNATLIGENVGFYLTGNTAKTRFGTATTVSLTAPKKGPLAGILFFEDRNSILGREFEISSKDARRLVGAIYLPKGYLSVKGKSQFAGASEWTAVIAQEVRLDNGPILQLNSNYSASNIPVPEGIAAKAGRAFLTN